MKKIIAAVLAAATFASTLSFAASAATSIDSGAMKTNFDAKYNGVTTGKTVFVEDGDIHNSDVIYPGKSIFIEIDQSIANVLTKAADKDYFTYKIKAIEGAKHVASYSYFVGKKDLKVVPVVGGTAGTLQNRKVYVQVKLKDYFTDTENKIKLELDIKGKKDFTGTLTYTTPYIYINNKVEDGTDLDIAAGTAGKMFKPVKNEDNQIVWNDEMRDVARLTFFADSDVAKTYPKLNTKWNESDYADYFAAQDAFLFEFVSNPYVSSTSRATLEIYNPYYDEDTDTVTVDPAEVIIYQVTEEGLVDVTELFKHGENEDGDLVFSIKTRQLGTYIFAEAEATVEEVEDPEDVVEPEDIKKPVDTGR